MHSPLTLRSILTFDVGRVVKWRVPAAVAWGLAGWLLVAILLDVAAIRPPRTAALILPISVAVSALRRWRVRQRPDPDSSVR